MADIIQLLPDSVANQIAAGEVIQRPASVVKELVENSVDAGSSIIKVIVRDSGKNLIQIIDNGCGMSETDARLSFERHATSKIRSADDLFSISTMGFRGEALASVAAIAEIEMQTRHNEDELGTLVEIKGAKFIRQEPVACQAGCNIIIRNLFFNVPARRKFLKTNPTELKHIITEFQRIALAHPETEFSLQHEGTEILHLPPAGLRKRLINIFGRNINQQLIEINTETNLVNIGGYISKPEYAKKSPGEQFFFVNNRFMRHPFFHKAIVQAFEKILPANTIPSYFINFQIDPQSIDVNIHPTKTEIKFENERSVWQILMASVREALGKFNIVPSIDFDTEGRIDIPIADNNRKPVIPEIAVDHSYNPFETAKPSKTDRKGYGDGRSRFGNWEDLYKDFESDSGKDQTGRVEEASTHQSELANEDGSAAGFPALLQIKNKYILSPVKSGLMIIDQRRAHERILFEKFMKIVVTGSVAAQRQLYPVSIELSPSDYLLMREISGELAHFGFDINDLGPNSIMVSGCPADTVHADTKSLVETMLYEYRSSASDPRTAIREKISRNLARSSAINYGKPLSREEMHELVDRLFACEMPNYSPGGKPVITIISSDEIEKRFSNP